MSMTPGQFTLSIDAMVKDLVEDEVILVVKKLSMAALRGVVMKSPVDTGRFRGNWNVGIGSQDLSVSDSTDKGGGATLSSGTSEIDGVEDLTVVWITNNLPYAMALENGHSKIQAPGPGGIVALTFAELETMDYDA